MKLLNKLLIASTMVVTLGATASCGGQKSNNGFVAGLPYTMFSVTPDYFDCTIGFKYEGDQQLDVYWNNEEVSHETTHTFTDTMPGGEPLIVLIKGKVTSLWFTDKDGKSVAEDNYLINAIVFSNTITSLPEYACSSLYLLRNIYIPGSITKIGEYAFSPFRISSGSIICEAEHCPSGWNERWLTSPKIPDGIIIWGTGCYICDDGQCYVLYSHESTYLAEYYGYLVETGITEINIPNTITINERTFNVCSVYSLGAACYSVKNLTIPSSISYVAPAAFEYCLSLETVTFDGNFDLLDISVAAFHGCYSLETVTFKGKFNVLRVGERAFTSCYLLYDVNFEDAECNYVFFDGYTFTECVSLEIMNLPKGLTIIPRELFGGCICLSKVTIPSTVVYISDGAFFGCSYYEDEKGNPVTLTIDVTAFKDPKYIALCEELSFDACRASKIKFIHNPEVAESDFVNRNWPTTSTEGRLQIEWATPTTLNA